MKKSLFLLSVIALAGCSSNEAVVCTDCNKAPTAVLIPNANNTMKPTPSLEQELIANNITDSDSVLISPVPEHSYVQDDVSESIGTQIGNLIGNKIPANSAMDSQTIAALFALLAERVKEKWGSDGYIESGKHRYVKYLDSYTTRADIHFDSGKIYVSTIAAANPTEKLRQAIVQILLMPPNPRSVDMFGSKSITPEGKPFFLGQVLDQDGQAIQWKWRAVRFANYLLEHKLKKKQFAKATANYVEIDLVKNHMDLREYQYAPEVIAASKRYNVPEDVIYAVIKTESSFNPYAVSHAGAFGLMQIIPSTAGADVFKLVKNVSGVPSKEYLFDPNNNIDTGVAYLHILRDRYLRDLSNLTSKHFAMVSAYNSGTGGVLSAFNNDRKKAVQIINSTNPRKVYDVLTTQHPKEEARRYLLKVLTNQKNFNLDNV